MPNHCLTVNAIELSCTDSITDILTQKPLKMDTKINTIVGQQEHIIQSIADILEVSKLIEQRRSIESTKMNIHSSRSHCIIEIKLYKKSKSFVHINSLRFVDMAGSETIVLQKGKPT